MVKKRKTKKKKKNERDFRKVKKNEIKGKEKHVF